MTTRGVERVGVKSASLMTNETETRDERDARNHLSASIVSVVNGAVQVHLSCPCIVSVITRPGAVQIRSLLWTPFLV